MKPLFVNGQCTLCKKAISNHGRYSHGMAHVRRNESVVGLNPLARYSFSIATAKDTERLLNRLSRTMLGTIKHGEIKEFHCSSPECKVFTFELKITGYPATRNIGDSHPTLPQHCPFCGRKSVAEYSL